MNQIGSPIDHDAIHACMHAFNISQFKLTCALLHMHVCILYIIYMWQSRVENEHYSVRTNIEFSPHLGATGLVNADLDCQRHSAFTR